MNFFDLRNPWFIPMWRRVALFLVCLLWGGFELVSGSVAWAVPFLGLAVYSGWVFFIDWKDPPEGE